jgi:hypothetical protein
MRRDGRLSAVTDWDARPIEEIEADAAPEALSAAADSTGATIRTQLALLAVFIVVVGALFAVAGSVLATGGGCGGG